MITSEVTWTELDCGCTASDDGWWIVNVRCLDHRRFVPDEAMVWMLRPNRAYGRTYGPVREEVMPTHNGGDAKTQLARDMK